MSELIENDEIWVDIEDFPGYMVSSFGRIKNKKNNMMRKTPTGKRGYPVVSLCMNGKVYLKTVHQLVAKAFIPNPNNFPQVNHKDGVKTHSYLTNLEWVTPRENNIHARKTGLHKSDGDKAVYQIDKYTGIIINEYKSVSDAARKTGISRSAITSALHGYSHGKISNNRTGGGYIWRFVDNERKEEDRRE